MILAIILTIAGFLILPFPAYAVSVSISNTPSTISNQPFNIDVSVTGAAVATNYLRANLFPTGTTNYFGYTYNGSSFVNSSDYSQYFPITIDSSGNWSGTIQAKLDSSSSYFSGSGNYSLKVRRYTQSGSSYTWSNEVTLAVDLATPTPTSTPTSSSSPSSSTSPTLSAFTISGVPSQTNSDQSFNVSVNLSLPDNPNTSFYLKGAFKKSDSSNYFGYTKVSGNWVKNGSTFSNQFTITTDSSGNWSGNLEIKPDPDDSGFTGTGDYIFKVGRYTSTGSGPIWSNEATIKINSVESNKQITTTSNKTSSTTKPFFSPTVKSIVTSSNKSKSPSNLVYQIASVTGATTSGSATPSAVEVKSEKRPNFLAFIGGALILCGIGSLAYIYLRNRKIV